MKAVAKTERGVGRQQELLWGLIQNSTVAMFVVDRRHRVLLWNRACEELTGVRAGELLNTDGHWSAFYREKRPCLADLMMDGKSDEIPRWYPSNGRSRLALEGRQAEGWFTRRDGDHRCVAMDAYPVHASDGEVMAVAETLVDVTEFRAAAEAMQRKEEELVQLQKIEAVGRLAGGIAHTFNNLLTSILGFGRLLKENLGREHPLREDVDEIIQSGEKAAKLTKQLLAFSRRQVVQSEPVNLNAVVLDVGRLLRQTMGEHIELVILAEKEVWPVLADAVLMEQVVMNLALNAREAMPAGGVLRIETMNVSLDERYCRRHADCRPGKYVSLVVSDTGQGMSPEVRAHVFEPFFTTGDRSRHSGLGLSTVYGIVRQFGGQIDFESEIGRGTAFTICLPAADRPVPAGTAAADETLPGGGECILVVEDDGSVRRLAVRMLESLGYKVLEAGSGEEGLRMAGVGGPIDLVLADVVMPRMGGQEMVRHLREQLPGLKVLFTSGFTDGALVDHGLLESGDPIILKPYSRESMAVKVRQVLDEG